MKPYNRSSLSQDRCVLSHGLYRHKRGKCPSMSYEDRANPQAALAYVVALFVRDHFTQKSMWANHMVDGTKWNALRKAAEEYGLDTSYYPAEGVRASHDVLMRAQKEFGDAVLSHIKSVVCQWFRKYYWLQRELSRALRAMHGSPRLT